MLTALIAEDELLVRLGISSCVSRAELDIAVVGEVEDGMEAWKLFQKYRPDIVILDLLMPGLNGIELLRRIRAVDRRCAAIVVTNVDKEDILEEVRRLGVTRVLTKLSMKRDDISAAVRMACDALLPKAGGETGQAMDKQKAWEELLFGDGVMDASFEAQGMTGIRLFPNDRLTPALQRSLSALILQRLGDPGAYALFDQDSCRLLVWNKTSARHISEGVLLDFARYVQDNLHINLGVVTVFETVAGTQLSHVARRFVALLHEPRLFDYPVLRLDANGEYRDARLDALRSELAICLPMCAERDELRTLKSRLDRYPGALDEGFGRVLGNAADLLKALNLPVSQPGLWEMTGCICAAMEERVNRVIARVRPEIHRVMAHIQAHLAENLPRELLSDLANYDSAYFSKLFKAEVGMSCTDYLLQARILRAQELLRGTDMPISDIAARCGFFDSSYFSGRFRQICGMTPREWRDDHGETTA